MRGTSGDGWTPLMLASSWGNAKVVEALLDAGADKELKATSGWAGRGRPHLTWLGMRTRVTSWQSSGRGGGRAAAAAPTKKKELSAAEQKKQNEALWDAAENGEMGKLEAAIAAGAEVDWHNPDSGE